MTSTLPPDPYKLLGVTKDAKLPEIRSAHRKLVLKCHPDKVQDAALKAVKQDEFQKVQQAYELLSDDHKRTQYDEQVKLFALRKEMGRGNPTPRSNPFEYEVKTAEPRASSYARPSPKVYSYPNTPKSNEEVYRESSRHMPRKSASDESSSERRRAAAREEEMRKREAWEAATRKAEEDRVRQKERDREAKRASEKKKSKEKERKRGADDKPRSRQQSYVEDDSTSDEAYRASRAASAKQRQRIEEEIRKREAEAAVAAQARRAQEQQRANSKPKEAPMTDKWNGHKDFAGAYMQAARRKVVEAESPKHPGMRRAETFSANSSPTTYNVRYAAPQQHYSDEEMPKRSSASRKEATRRASDTPAKSSSSRRRSPAAAQTSDPVIVEPPSPTSAPRKPSLQSYSSAPPNFAREVPVPLRPKVPDYSRPEPSAAPPPRAQAFPTSDRSRERSSGVGKMRHEYTSGSESDSTHYHAQQRPHSPPPRRPAEPTREPTRYIVENGRANPVPTRAHRSDLRHIDTSYVHDQSEPPRNTPSATRPPISRNPASSERPRASSRVYSSPNYASVPEAPEPVILTTAHRPKLNREGSNAYRATSRGASGAAYENVSFAKSYAPENVIYSPATAAVYDGTRRGSEVRERGYQPTYHSRPAVYT